MCPGADNAASPRPVNSDEPQWATGSRYWIRGVTLNECPVHARSADLCATIQSVVPSRCSIENVVVGDLVDINAVSGVVEDMRW